MIANRVFILRPDPYVGATPAGQVFRSTTIAKQNRLCHDAGGPRNILFGGDYANTLVGQTAAGMTWSYDPVLDINGADAQQGFRQISQECHGPGNLTPGQPDDSQACGMDYLTDAFTVNPGGWRDPVGTCTIASDGKCLSTPGSTYYTGLMRMARNGSWTGLSTGLQVGAAKNGHFDPVKRCLTCIDSGAANITRIYVDTLTRDDTAFTASSIGSNTVPGRSFSPSYNDGVDWGIDIVGRWGYVISVGDFFGPAPDFNYSHSENYFWRFNLDTPSIQQILANPPFGSHDQWLGGDASGGDSFLMFTLGPTGFPLGAAGTDRYRCQWDSTNRRLMWFYTRSIGAGVHGIGAYDPVTNTWENIPIVTDGSLGGQTYKHVAGNCMGYDSTNNVHILMGAAALGTPGDDPYREEDSQNWSPTSYSLWRYA